MSYRIWQRVVPLKIQTVVISDGSKGYTVCYKLAVEVCFPILIL